MLREAASGAQARHHVGRRLRHVHRLPVVQDDSGLVRDLVLLRQIGPVHHHPVRQDLPQPLTSAGKRLG